MKNTVNMDRSFMSRNWWIPVLAVFDLLYYLLVQFLVERRAVSELKIQLEALIFVFLISLLSIWCVYFIKARLDKISKWSIPVKYLQLLLLSFIVFILIISLAQFSLEYALGQQRDFQYVISNLIIYIFLHIIVGNAAIALAYFRESRQLIEHLLVSEKAKTESELRVLQQQMNPHFLFNNLNSLMSLIPEDANKAVNYTKRLSNIFRHVSSNAKRELISLEEELVFLNDYMELLNYRFGNAYVLKLNMDGLNTKEVLIVPLALQVIIENVVKHNSGSRSNPLKVEMKVSNNCIEIRNDINEKALEESDRGGIGLKNLNERFFLSTGQRILYGKEDAYFVVKLPIIKSLDDVGIAN